MSFNRIPDEFFIVGNTTDGDYESQIMTTAAAAVGQAVMRTHVETLI